MKKRTLFLIVSCSLASLITVTTLFVLSEDLTHSMNSFTRIFPPHPISEGITLSVGNEPSYIAGVVNNKIYIANYTAPLELKVLNMDASASRKIKFKTKDGSKPLLRGIRVQIDSPYYYIMAGGVPIILRGHLDDGEASQYSYDSAYFSKIIPVSNVSFAIRTESASTGEFVLGKINSNRPRLELKHDLLKKQIDGIFCTDGMINYDKAVNKLIYSYYYRNQFIVMDTNLNQIYLGKTIDTVSKAKINVVSVKGGEISEMNAPPLRVNNLSYAAGGYLFVNSNLIGKDEKREIFDNYAAIDVYELTNGEYRFSLYIGDEDKSKLQDIYVQDETLIALFETRIKTYKLHEQYFKLARL